MADLSNGVFANVISVTGTRMIKIHNLLPFDKFRQKLAIRFRLAANSIVSAISFSRRIALCQKSPPQIRI